ncbi:MAG: hypothetical protein ACI3V2_05065, partial [Faecousia sp.]
MSSIREMRSTTQTGTIKPDAAASFSGGTTSIRKLRTQKLPTQTSVRRTAPIAAPQQRLLDVPEQKENSTPDTQAEDWTKAGQRFLQNSPMKNGASPQESQNDDLQFHQKIVAYAPQVLETQDRLLREEIAGYENTARGAEATARRLDDIRFYYGGTRNEDGSIAFPTEVGADAYNQALDRLLGDETEMQAYAARIQKTASSRNKAYDTYTQSRDTAFAAYDKLSPEEVNRLAENGDTAAALYLQRENEEALTKAQSYMDRGGTIERATDTFAAAEKDYIIAVTEYDQLCANVKDNVNDVLLNELKHHPRYQEIEEAKLLDEEYAEKNGILPTYDRLLAKLKELGYTDEMIDGLFIGTSYGAITLSDAIARREIAEQTLHQKESVLRECAEIKDAVWLYHVAQARSDAQFEELSAADTVVAGALDGDFGRAYRFLATISTKDAEAYGDEQVRQQYEISGVDLTYAELAQLSEEERRLFFYYSNKGDRTMAELLLVSLADDLRRRAGADMAEKLDYPLLREVAAFAIGGKKGAEALGYGIGSIFADIDAPELDAEDYFLSSLQEKHDRTFAGYAISAFQNIGNMMPSVAGYLVNPYVGTAATFLNARGNAYVEAKRNGYTHGQAWVYSTLVGASEAGLERLLGSMGGIAKGVLPQKLAALAPTIKSTAGRLVKDFALNTASELLEENLQNYLEPAFAMFVGAADHYEAPDLDDFIETSVVTLMTTTVFAAFQAPGKVRQWKFDDQMGKWADAAMKADKNSNIYQEGAKIRELLAKGEHISGTYMQEVFARLGEDGSRRVSAVAMETALTENAESTSVDTRSAGHTVAEQQTIHEYEKSTDNGLLAFIKKIRGLSDQKYRTKISYIIGIVTQRQVQDVKILTGVDVSEYRNAITGGAIDHITKRHGAHGIADNSMRNDADIARIGYVLENYDSAELLKDENGNAILSTEWQNKDQTKAKMVRFAKKIDGTYYVVEAVPDSGKKTLRVVSAYLQKDSGSSTRLLNMGETPPQLTPKTPAGMATSAIDSLSQLTQTVNTKDDLAAYSDNALIYTALISLGVHKAAAESLAKNYDPADGISPEIYARGAAEAFFYGKGNFSETELRNGNGLSPVLTELQRSTAYRLGQIFQERQTTKEEAAIAQKKAAAKESGSVAQSQKGNVYYDGDHSRLTERQKVSVRALEKLAQALGVDFYLYESERDAAGKPIGANGWYDQKTGDIHIDLNAGEFGEGTILFTAAHELTHFLRQWSPSKFKVLSDFLVEQYGAKGQSVADLVRNQQAKAKRNGRSLRWMQAYEEMVADSMETMLSDGTVIEKLTKLSAKDKGLVQKLLHWLKGFAAKLKRAYQNQPADSAEGRLVAEMTDTIDHLQTLFTEGLAQAGENYRAAGGQINSTQAEKTVVYYCQRSPKLVSETEVKSLLDKVKCKEISGNGYIPIRISTPGIVQERLFAEDIPMVIPVSKAYQAMSVDLGPTKGKNVRGHDLSPQDLVEIIKRMDSPDYVFSQPKNDRGIEVIKYGTPEGNIAVIIEFSNNINPAYLNGYKGGAY